MSMKFLKAMNKECEFLKDSFKIFEKKGFFSSISGELQIFDINNHLSGIHEMIDDDTYDPKIDSVGNEDEILQLDREISDKSLKHLRLLNTLKLPLTKPIKDNLMTEVKTLRSEVEDLYSRIIDKAGGSLSRYVLVRDIISEYWDLFDKLTSRLEELNNKTNNKR